MIIPLNTNSTIAELRRAGIKVAVLRRITEDNRRVTRIVITDKEQRHAEGFSVNHPLERYNRKIGNKIALGRAIKNYNEGNNCGFEPLAIEL